MAQNYLRSDRTCYLRTLTSVKIVDYAMKIKYYSFIILINHNIYAP